MHGTCKVSNCNAQGHSAGKKNKGGYLNSDGVCFMEFEKEITRIQEDIIITSLSQINFLLNCWGYLEL